MPIVPDEARTFGMEALFRQVGIYSHAGQVYEPVDMATLLYYKEASDGQILEEGHQRSRIDVVVHRRRHGVRHPRREHHSVLHLLLDVRLPADRRSDLGGRRFAHARLHARRHRRAARRWPAKACSTRTATATCSRIAFPNCVAYDPAFAYEIAVIIQDGIRRMYVDQESIFYYLTVMNEQYAMPVMPEGVARRHPQGAVSLPRDVAAGRAARARSSSAAARSCPRSSRRRRFSKSQYDVGADVWSVTSYGELYRDGHACERWNLLHPDAPPARPVRHQVPQGRPRRARRRVRLCEGAARLDRPLAAAAR